MPGGTYPQAVYEKLSDLARAVPVDIFLWSVRPPQKPFLTKLGGVPHRESAKAWPTAEDGKAYTFVAQFCFLDSKDIVSDNLPNDVMLIFFRDADGAWDPSAIHVEWSSVNLESADDRWPMP